MSKQKNDNIGLVVCGYQGCTELAAVRRNRGGKLYFDCHHCGRFTPNLEGGQKALESKATIWEGRKPPANCPRWIAENKTVNAVWRDPGLKAPLNGESPVKQGEQPPPPASPVTTRPRPSLPKAPPPPPHKPQEAETAVKRDQAPKPGKKGGFGFLEGW